MIKALIRTMRPRQWTKNVFVMAAVVFDRQLTHPIALARSVSAMVLFCILSSCVYIINDLIDVEADRNHPIKCHRPIASGDLSPKTAIIALVILLAITFPLTYLLSPQFALISLIYFLGNLAYSFWLKHIVILDVIVLASFYVLRVGAGVSVINVERFSPWLYVVTTLFALFLAFGKRRAELALLTDTSTAHRRSLDGYTQPLLDQFITIVSTSTIIAYSFYTFSAPNLPTNDTMMLTIPFVMYGIFRYMYLISVKKSGGQPEEMLLKDRPLQATIFLYGLSVIAIFYFSAHL
jgi:4-hydroxybenzoate polyprenyltransferase